MVKKGADQGDQGAMPVAYLILAIFGGLGVIGMAIAAVAVAVEARVRASHGSIALGVRSDPPRTPARRSADTSGR